MVLSTENILLIGSILLFVSLLAGKTSNRLGVPVLVLFLAIGMLAGSDGIGGIYFDNPGTAQFIGIIALNFILFSGGLDTDLGLAKSVMWQGIALSTAGVMITAALVGIFVWLVTDFTLLEGLLLGSIVSSTDSAAVFSILRSKNLALKGNLRPILELESGSNDPMAYILTIVLTGLVTQQTHGTGEVVQSFLSQLMLGSLSGVFFGLSSRVIINQIRLDYEGLYIVLVIAIMFFAFSATDFIGGNGFLSVYLCAIIMGNKELMHRKKIIKSFDSFAWLMQIVLFLTLGLLVFPSQIVPVIGIGMLTSVFLILIARPVSVFISLIPFRVQQRSRWFISWVGLRGAVPIVFATYPLIAGADKAQTIFNIVFFISLTSLLIQGTTLPLFARWLHLSLPEKVKQRTQADLAIEEGLKSKLTGIRIPEGSEADGKQILHLGMPPTCVISYIIRGQSFVIPTGATRLKAHDTLYILSEDEASLAKAYECLGAQPDETIQIQPLS